MAGADQSDVEQALVTLISGALYPLGESAASTVGPTCRIYRGWPNAAALDADLAAGRINVTVFPVDQLQRNTTRFPDQWQAVPAPPTLTASVAGLSVSFAGSAAAGQLAGVLADDSSYVYRTQTGDTPAMVAAALAVALRADRIAQLSDATITIPNAGRLIARTAADTAATQELRRQQQGFRITAWCPSPATRDAVAIAIDPTLAALTFIALPDGSAGRLRFASTTTFDQQEDAALYRRDLLYTVEYATTATALQPAMLFGDLVLNGTSFIA